MPCQKRACGLSSHSIPVSGRHEMFTAGSFDSLFLPRCTPFCVYPCFLITRFATLTQHQENPMKNPFTRCKLSRVEVIKQDLGFMRRRQHYLPQPINQHHIPFKLNCIQRINLAYQSTQQRVLNSKVKSPGHCLFDKLCFVIPDSWGRTKAFTCLFDLLHCSQQQTRKLVGAFQHCINILRWGENIY